MAFNTRTMGFSIISPHTCREPEVQVPVVDVTIQMKAMVDEMALFDVSLPARTIWNTVRSPFYSEDNGGVTADAYWDVLHCVVLSTD